MSHSRSLATDAVNVTKRRINAFEWAVQGYNDGRAPAACTYHVPVRQPPNPGAPRSAEP
jgi:hypothetical protein